MMNKLLKILSEEIKKNLIIEVHSTSGKYPSPLGPVNYSYSKSEKDWRAGRDYGAHNAADIRVDSGTIIYSPLNGIVIDSTTRYSKPCGGAIIIEDENKVRMSFCHVRKFFVQKGQSISIGDPLGETGGGKNDPYRGRSSGPHLHFKVRHNGRVVKPWDWVDFTVSPKEMSKIGVGPLSLPNFDYKTLSLPDTQEIISNIDFDFLPSNIKLSDILKNKDNRDLILKGVKGEGVEEFQKILYDLGYDLGNFGPNGDGIDGKFGSKTKNAVKEFQKDHGLKVDGIIGIETATTLSQYLFSMKNI